MLLYEYDIFHQKLSYNFISKSYHQNQATFCNIFIEHIQYKVCTLYNIHYLTRLNKKQRHVITIKALKEITKLHVKYLLKSKTRIDTKRLSKNRRVGYEFFF